MSRHRQLSLSRSAPLRMRAGLPQPAAGSSRLVWALPVLFGLVSALAACMQPPTDSTEAAPVAIQQGLGTPFARNVALNNPSKMSSQYQPNFPARNANDGAVGMNYPFTSVPMIAHTASETNPWWQVDTLDVLWINEIVIYGRRDCCQDRLKPFEVRVSSDEVNWTQIYYSATQPPLGLRIEANVAARYVQVRLLGTGTLELDEVQVLQTEKGPNVAQLGTASQSSTGWGGDPIRAIDGNKNGVFGNGSVTHTLVEAQPWWQVDLGKSRSIGEVVLHNRTDCCGDRLSDFDVKVSEDQVVWFSLSYSGTPSFPLTVPINKRGRYVRVQLRGTNALSLAEVEVNITPQNLALRRPAAQSSTLTGGDAWHAVDGNTDAVWANGSLSHTRQIDYTVPAWWEVNLDSLRAISGVVVYNRSDCCIDRLSNYRIFVSRFDTSVPFNSRENTLLPAHAFRASDLGSYTAWNGFAQSIRIDIPAGNDLHMAEFKVLAPTTVCPYGQTLLDGTTCVTLRRFSWGDTTPLDGRRIAIKQKKLLIDWTLQPVDRWLGNDGGRINSVDGDLRSRDLFTVRSFKPSGASGNGLPWYTLQADSGGYVYLSASGDTLFSGAGTPQDDGWMLTRGLTATYEGSLQRIRVTNGHVSSDYYIDNRFKYAQEWYTRITTKGYPYGERCLRPYFLSSQQRLYWEDLACSADTNQFEYYLVE